MQQYLWCVKNEATWDTLHSKGVSTMIFKSELVLSNPLLYTSLFLLGFIPAFNLIAPGYYGCWDYLLLLHWVVCCSKLIVLLGSSPASNICLLQVIIIIELPPYFQISYVGLSLLLGFLPAIKLVFHTVYHSTVLLLWTFSACYLPINLMTSLCQAIIYII